MSSEVLGEMKMIGLNLFPSQPVDLTMRRQIIALVLTLPSLGHATPLSQSETQDLVDTKNHRSFEGSKMGHTDHKSGSFSLTGGA
jgi:hypothetical protein